MKNVDWNKVIRRAIIPVIIVLIIIIAGLLGWNRHVQNYSMTINDAGLEILNAYEFPTYLIEDDTCMRPYDVGDGVITFGPGITYPTEQDGLDDINQRFNEDYTLEDNCINIDTLHTLQLDIIATYEDIVNKVAIWKFKHFTQDEFNALVLMSYNSPNLFNNEKFVEVIISDNPTQEQYIEAADNYYKTLGNYYDNHNTDEPDDGFGKGWYNRIVDSSEVFFSLDYEYQNNAIY